MSMAANCPKAPLLCQEGWLVICRVWFHWVPVPAPAHPSAFLYITSSGRLQSAKADSENILDHEHYFQQDAFSYTTQIFSQMKALSHHHEWGAVCCSREQKWGTIKSNTRGSNLPQLLWAQGETQDMYFQKNHIYNYAAPFFPYLNSCIIFFPMSSHVLS